MFALRRVVTRSRPPSVNAARCTRPTARRAITSLTPLSPRRGRPRLLGTLALTSAVTGSAYLYLHQPVSLDSSSPFNNETENEEPLSTLLRTYIVYSMCSIPWLVDNSSKILDVLMSIPLVKQVTEAFVRATFFAQVSIDFVGGETAQDMLRVLERMRTENKGAIIHFSAEVDEHASSASADFFSSSKKLVNTEVIKEFTKCIDTAGDFEDSWQAKIRKGETGEELGGRKTFVAMKLTALIPNANTLLNFSKHLTRTRSKSSPNVPFPGAPRPTDLDILSVDPFDLPPTCPLTKEDLESLNALKEELFKLCRRAKERGVSVCIDAEYSWYQPAIEAFQLALMREFNRVEPSTRKDVVPEISVLPSGQPQIYGTAPEHLEQTLRDAEEGRYSLGVKLVRGAYHESETTSHRHSQSHTSSSSSISPDPLPPVWATKAETDACFDQCARILVRRLALDVAEESKQANSKGRGGGRVRYVPRLALIFGTHNPGSCELVLNALVDEGLAVRARPTSTSPTGEEKSKEGKIEIKPSALRRVCVGQLYGMCDALSTSLTRRTINTTSSGEEPPQTQPFVIKCTPYGPLARVMPYLSRRALENKSVLGGSQSASSPDSSSSLESGGVGGARGERERARREIARRIRRFFGF
ncbi:FAD-linked oxidoreductase [Sanghuangporus baumii]|uniref:Proline dehydrogenase n=1 Tax=Sanghuangporus baumii TaxID=108892 RepID=A0A9Q5N7E2_SANBA|nr:FAD-linked oxidoreductase [Sanghuangporus baumii]